MDNAPTEQEIVNNASDHGLVRCLLALENARSLASDGGFLQMVAHLASSGKIPLRGDGDDAYMAAMDTQPFFSGARLMCKLIPFLSIDRREVMRLVRNLVDRGGNDLTANEPNAAFRKWCANDVSRAEAVLKDARDGDPDALDLLCFALEAGARADDAIAFLTSDSPRTVVSAALALSRMEISRAAGQRAATAISRVAANTQDDRILQHAVLACFAVLGRNRDLPRPEAGLVLDHALAHGGQGTKYALATLLTRTEAEISDDEIHKILAALKDSDPEMEATVEHIDMAARKLTASGHFGELMDVVATHVVQAGLTFDSFERVWAELVRGDGRLLRELAVDWLRDGNPRLCNALRGRLGRFIDKPLTLDLEPALLPDEAKEQVFLCRKAVGHLFVLPITAASVLVSVLKNGHPGATDDVADLLYDPLLVNYIGDLRTYVAAVADENADSFGPLLGKALERSQDIADLGGLAPLPELQPSEERRHIDYVHRTEEMSDAVRKGSRKSVFSGLTAEIHLAYGMSATMYVDDPSASSGAKQRVDVSMQPLSVSMELPRMSIFDPVGIEYTLWHLRTEGRGPS